MTAPARQYRALDESLEGRDPGTGHPKYRLNGAREASKRAAHNLRQRIHGHEHTALYTME
jgi:hypothetical protein